MGTTTTERRFEGRYIFGKPNGDGNTPVYVDGATSPSGYVRSTGHGATPWTAVAEEAATGPAAYPDFDGRRWQAAERIVALIDARAERAAEERGAQERSDRTPEGYRRVSWEDVERSGFLEVRVPRWAPYVDASHNGKVNAGPRRVDGWSAVVRLRTITRLLFNGQVCMSGSYADGSQWHGGGDRAWMDLGALVAAEGAPVLAPPAGRTWWKVGDLVAYDTPGADGIIDTYRGPVVETNTHIERGEFVASVHVEPFDYRMHLSTQITDSLYAVESVEQQTPRKRGRWSVGTEAVHTTYNLSNTAFSRDVRVIGFSQCPVTGAPMVRVASSSVRAALAVPSNELYRRGEWEGWQNRSAYHLACPECNREIGEWEGSGERPAMCSPSWWTRCVRRPIGCALHQVTYEDEYGKVRRCRLMNAEDAQDRAAYLRLQGYQSVNVRDVP